MGADRYHGFILELGLREEKSIDLIAELSWKGEKRVVLRCVV